MVVMDIEIKVADKTNANNFFCKLKKTELDIFNIKNYISTLLTNLCFRNMNFIIFQNGGFFYDNE